MASGRLAAAVTEPAADVKRTYTGGEERPLGSFLALMAGYGVAFAGASAVTARRRGLPDRLDARDIALVTVAVHKAARLLTKETITSPLRAPFTEFVGSAGDAELVEEVRGSGPRKAMGELVTCPFCIAMWLSTSFSFGLVLAPRPTRFIATVLTVLAGSDTLQLLYASAQRLAEG